MFARITTASLIGLQARMVTVEVDVSYGLPSFSLVGLGATSVRESRERVRSALRNSRLPYPSHRITVNLAPASLPKDGSQYDLPIAVGLLQAAGHIGVQPSSQQFFGELSLTGRTCHTNGVLAAIGDANSLGINEVFVPLANQNEASLYGGKGAIYLVENLTQLANHLSGKKRIMPLRRRTVRPVNGKAQEIGVDFSHINGLSQVKRALEIAAAGNHNLMLSGPPGTGKTLAAQALISILPPLDASEIREVTRLYSIAGLLSDKEPAKLHRPFRMPHHTTSLAALIGGGQFLRPGEVSLAHRGVLLLDEIPEFDRNCIEALRQPLEGRTVTLARTRGNVTYPADLMLVATRNLCPCGHLGAKTDKCQCTSAQIQRYRRRLSSPILERFDLHVAVPQTSYDDLVRTNNPESSETVRARVATARRVQYARYPNTLNAAVLSSKLEQYVQIDSAGHTFLRQAMQRYGYSSRTHFRILRVARTIADLNERDKIEVHDLAEACQYAIGQYQQ